MVFKTKLFKEFQDGWLFYAWPSLIFKWIDLSNDSVSPFCVSLRSNRHLFLKKKILFEELKTAAIVAQHNEPVGCRSTIPSLMPYKLSLCLL